MHCLGTLARLNDEAIARQQPRPAPGRCKLSWPDQAFTVHVVEITNPRRTGALYPSSPRGSLVNNRQLAAGFGTPEIAGAYARHLRRYLSLDDVVQIVPR